MEPLLASLAFVQPSYFRDPSLSAEASLGRAWGGVTSLLMVGLPAAVYCWPSSTDTPSLEDGQTDRCPILPSPNPLLSPQIS